MNNGKTIFIIIFLIQFLSLSPYLQSEKIPWKFEGFGSVSTRGLWLARTVWKAEDWNAFYKERNSKESEKQHGFGFENAFLTLGTLKTGGLIKEITTAAPYSKHSSVFTSPSISIDPDPSAYSVYGCRILPHPSVELFFLHESEERYQTGFGFSVDHSNVEDKAGIELSLLGSYTRVIDVPEEVEWFPRESPVMEKSIFHFSTGFSWYAEKNLDLSLHWSVSQSYFTPPAYYINLRSGITVFPCSGSRIDFSAIIQLWDSDFISARGNHPLWKRHWEVKIDFLIFPQLRIYTKYEAQLGFPGKVFESWIRTEEKMENGIALEIASFSVDGKWNRTSVIEGYGEYSLKNEITFTPGYAGNGVKVIGNAGFVWEKESLDNNYYGGEIQLEFGVLKPGFSFKITNFTITSDNTPGEIHFQSRLSLVLGFEELEIALKAETEKDIILKGDEEKMQKSDFLSIVVIQLSGKFSYQGSL